MLLHVDMSGPRAAAFDAAPAALVAAIAADHAGLAKPERVGRVVEDWGRDLIGGWNAHDWIGAPQRIGAKIAALIGAQPHEVIVADSVTINLFKLILGILSSRFKARATLEAENLVLRQQVNVLRRRTPKRPHLNNTDRFLFVWLYRWFPSVLEVVAIVRPETIIRWHRAGFRAHWRWRSRNRVGRPKVSAELRTLIGEMSRANALWGAPRIHGELLKLGFEVAQSTVARYMCRHSRPPSQGWRTFLSNQVDGIAAIDLFVLPTIAFQILYGLVIVRHGRRLWVSFGLTANPTGDWISRQVTEAFPWDHAPRYLIRDRDTSYGPVFLQRIRAWAFGTIRSHPDRPGRMLTLRDSSARSAANVSTT